jgi:hypothetical protein
MLLQVSVSLMPEGGTVIIYWVVFGFEETINETVYSLLMLFIEILILYF